MIESLRISNFALIESAQVDVSRGFTSITGETGAGKSVFLGALRAVLGERTGADMVRNGASRAMVEAIFRGPFPDSVLRALDDHGFLPEPEDDPTELILRREIQASGGTSRNFINGRTATLSQVREVTIHLVDMHAQHENGRLFRPTDQMALLDSFGDCEEAREAYRKAWKHLIEARDRLAEVRTLAAEGQRRVDYLRFQVEELSQAAPEPGEDEELEAERKRLSHAERLGLAASEAADALLDGEQISGSPAVELLRLVSRLTAEIVSLDPDQEPLAADADQLRYSLTDLGERLRDYASTVAGDPRRLQEIEDRLALLRGLRRKYQVEDSAGLVRLLESLQEELERIEHVDWELANDEKAHQEALKAAREAARTLGKQRREAARDFEALVIKEMGDLELPGALLKVELIPRESGDQESLGGLGPEGGETVEFLVAINPGTPPLPLRKVASGGEVARIMLAIKCVLATCDEVPTLVFDEIDVGISGQAAARVGEKLAALALHHQLLCITHLPQVAARGNQHILVEKTVENDRARSVVRLLDPKERRLALARMLGGHSPNDEAIRYAEKLLDSR